MTIEQRMRELAKLRIMQDELKQLIDEQETAIKDYMAAENLPELISEEHKATYKQVSTSRLDSSALKKALPDIAAAYTKTTSSMRFTFA